MKEKKSILSGLKPFDSIWSHYKFIDMPKAEEMEQRNWKMIWNGIWSILFSNAWNRKLHFNNLPQWQQELQNSFIRHFHLFFFFIIWLSFDFVRHMHQVLCFTWVGWILNSVSNNNFNPSTIHHSPFDIETSEKSNLNSIRSFICIDANATTTTTTGLNICSTHIHSCWWLQKHELLFPMFTVHYLPISNEWKTLRTDT